MSDICHAENFESKMNRVAEKTPLVLVVDDDESMRALLQMQMKRDGYRVASAESGPSALDTAAATPRASKASSSPSPRAS